MPNAQLLHSKSVRLGYLAIVAGFRGMHVSPVKHSYT